MRKLITTFAISIGLIASSASADQKTLDAMQVAGIELTQQEFDTLRNIQCNLETLKIDEKPSLGCQSLIDNVAGLISSYSADDAKVEAILRAASNAHPELAALFGEAAMIAVPTQIALIAQLMTEIAPTAAGLGLAVANPLGNIPTIAGGGGANGPTAIGGGEPSSPN